MNELIIGSHVSFTKQEQLLGSVMETLKYGANTFMFYTGAPQNTTRSSIDLELTAIAQKLMKESNIDINNVIVHAPYIINLANDKNFDFSTKFLKEEIRRVEMLGITKLVLHPGSHVGQGEDIGIANIIKALNTVLDSKTNVTILLETMAGKGTELGKTFEQLKQIIDGTTQKDKIGVCLDTCHINDSGYDLNDFDHLLQQFDQTIGLEKLQCLHINDSKNPQGSHKDRHENIGLGTIGFQKLLSVIYHDKLKKVPKILETPYITAQEDSKDKLYPPYKQEIDMIRAKKENKNLIQEIREYYKKD